MSKLQHPGWSVYFADGTWLCGAHGWFLSDDPFYADIYPSIEDAWRALSYATHAIGVFIQQVEVVPAWEPQYNKLQFQVEELQKAVALTPANILDITSSLEEALCILKRK